MEPTEHDALDAYSQVVSGVAEMLLPRVAAIRVRRRGRSSEASGSAVALTAEGHLITNAHVVGDADTAPLDALGKAAVSHQIVLTKADQVKASDLAERIEAIEAALKKRPAAFPHVLTTSSRTGDGMPELRAAIARLKAERGA